MKKSLITLLMAVLILTGCTTTVKEEPVSTNTPETKLKIIASFYPLAFIAQQIAAEKAEVLNLAGSVDVHEYKPTPKDMVQLNEADLLLFQGAELEPWTDGLISQLTAKGMATLEVTHDLDLIEIEEHEDHNEEKDYKEKHHNKEEHETDEHEEDHDEHNHGEFDPHTWLDPVVAQEMVEMIEEAISQVDPANEAFYEANAKALENKFSELHASYKSALSECAINEVVISHDAYGYLGKRYNFTPYNIAGLAPKDEPSAKMLAQLKAEAQEGITHVLVEENRSAKFAETLARETGLETLVINPLGRGTLNPNKDFFDIMLENLESLKVALNCQK